MAGNLGFGAVASAPVAGSGALATSPYVNAAGGNLGFGSVASAAVAGGVTAGTAQPTGIAGNLGFGAVASTAVANRSPTPLVTVNFPAVLAIASAGAVANASFIAAGSAGPVRASQVVMEVLTPFTETVKLRPFVWINT